MFTRNEAVKRLEDIEKEIQHLRRTLQEEWDEPTSPNETQHFLDKCSGWEDERPVDALIAEIYRARRASDRGADLFRNTAE